MVDFGDDTTGLVVSTETVANYWMLDILWSPLVSTEQTKGAYSLMEQLMPAKSGPPLHVHDHGDEVFYILDGEMALQLGDEVIVATGGQLVRIPAGTPHAFVVQSDTAKVLNIYVPGMLDMAIAMLGTPAAENRLPSVEDQHPPTPEQQAAFAERLHDLAMQTWSPEHDRLDRYRGDG
ncbi:MAG: cupin domain-containing protein [Mycobacterium sp.]